MRERDLSDRSWRGVIELVKRMFSARKDHPDDDPTRLQNPVRIGSRVVPGPGSRPHHRRRQRRLPAGDHDNAGRHRWPRPVRGLPRQPGRPWRDRRDQSAGLARKSAQQPRTRHDGDPEVRHPPPGLRRRRIRGPLLEPVELPGAGSRSKACVDHPPSRGRDRVHPSEGAGIGAEAAD